MYKNKKSGVVGVVITIIVLIIIVIFSNMNIENFSHVGGVLGSFVMPVQNGIVYIKNKITGNNTFFSDITTLKEENEKLKEEKSELEKSLRELEIIKSENETLKEYVNLKDKYTEYSTIPGYIINKDSSNYSNVVVINIGSDDGIKVNMAVISDEGLVGHVISVTNKTAKVITLLDTSSTISSSIGSNREGSIIRGTLDEKHELKATDISPSAAILEGDKVETSGLGGIYPKGIVIGTVSKITNTRNLTNRYAMIEPAVNFNKLEAVLVIVN